MSSARPHLASQRLVILLLLAIVASACVKRDFTQPRNPAPSNLSIVRININTASPGELEKLPGIGKALAARIIEHREKCGPFRRAEHLIIVRGFSDRRFRTLQE